MDMPLHPTWPDLLLRLGLTVAAGAVLGFNRERRGHAAGLRTTILVGLAAAVAMIQANVLLALQGKTPDSFGVMDLMRLPLGILTGVGFIGGGVILKKGDTITGVTTAATLWLTTAVSLCFGGGQIEVGVVATAIGWLVLWAVKRFDLGVPRRHEASLTLSVASDAPLPEVGALIAPAGYEARFYARKAVAGRIVVSYLVRWTQAESEPVRQDVVDILAPHCCIEAFTLRSNAEE
jgi:putative Mg2+ transporter-C (MgtC) family protein